MWNSVRVGVLLLVLCTSVTLAQTQYRVRLLRGWTKAGVSSDQRQKIYTIQAEYKEKIQKIELELQTLKRALLLEQIRVLTPAQQEVLVEKSYLRRSDVEASRARPKQKYIPRGEKEKKLGKMIQKSGKSNS